VTLKIAAGGRNIQITYVVHLHDTVYIGSHDHAEKSPWPLWVINGIKVHTQCIKCINNQQIILLCIFIVISSQTCFGVQSGHLQGDNFDTRIQLSLNVKITLLY